MTPSASRGGLFPFVVAGARFRRVGRALALVGSDSKSVVTVGRERATEQVVRGLFEARPSAWEDAATEFGEEWGPLLMALARAGIVSFGATIGGTRWASALRAAEDPEGIALDGRFVLSRYAYQRRRESALVVETALGHSVLLVEDVRVAAAVAALAQPCTADELRERASLSAVEDARILLAALAAARLIGAPDERGACVLDREPEARDWEFHDLVFHQRSRNFPTRRWGVGRAPETRRSPPPALVPARPPPLRTIELPGADAIESGGFFEILRARRSRRDHDSEGPPLSAIGALLREALRIKSTNPSGLAPGDMVARRPYPSGGGRGELTAYLAARQVEGLEPGLYRYGAQDHVLEQVSGSDERLDRLLADAAAATVAPHPIHALILLAVRHERVAWKYRSIAYSLILRNTGCAIATLALVAEALGLAACPVGYSSGGVLTFSELTGISLYDEGIVGELTVGRPRPDAPPTGKGARPA